MVAKKSIKVSIVLAYNTQVQMTLNCLDRLSETTKSFRKFCDLEVILVNGGCYTDIVHGLVTKFIKLDTNIGFSVTVNSGLREVAKDSDYVFYMGNDSFPKEPMWLEQLIELQQKTKAGIVCPANDRPGLKAYQHLYTKEESDYYECDFFPSIAYLITKDCFDNVGLWDESFVRSGMYGDNDYCKRTRNLGYKIVVSKDIMLFHLLSQEAPKLFNIDEDMNHNLQVYRNKWG